ncbi:MAG TPA: hypothetical protein VK459_04695 [Polyangiaceae bacterium]|jgi:hypothetical protein|nr:hypothetical protein [Polyangiaceae bacterium]
MQRHEVRVVVLCEDKAHLSFIIRLVDHLNLQPVRYERCGDSTGVLRRLGVEVDALRRRKHQKNLGLVILIDADEKGLQGRVNELLERIVTDTSDGARTEAERVALVVPAREIETWYVHLCFPAARPVDEMRDDYKKSPEWRQLDKDVGAAAKRAVDAWEPEPGRVDPASVTAARKELSRVQ